MATREGIKTLASELLYSAENGEPYSLVSYYDAEEPLTRTQKARLEAKLKESFELWRDTWIVPRVKQILAKYEKTV